VPDIETSEKSAKPSRRRRLYNLDPTESADTAPPPPETAKAAPDPLHVIPDVTEEFSTVSRLAEARGILKRRVIWSAGLGLIPVVWIDTVALTANVCLLLRELAELYGIPFPQERTRLLVASLLTGLGTTGLATSGLSYAVRRLPFLGALARVTLYPTLGAMTTYAIGRLFLCHFESGGTLLTFDPEAVRLRFQKELKDGQDFVSNFSQA
jgi:uncharacterized protein (DUF697 family)